MTTAACLLLVSLAVLSAADQHRDDHFYSSSGPSYPSSGPSYPSQTKPGGSIVSGLVEKYLRPISDRTDPGSLAAAPFLLFSLLILAVLGLAGIGWALTTALNSSGRGLVADDWEINHSVWMDQLTRDFEDSWSR